MNPLAAPTDLTIVLSKAFEFGILLFCDFHANGVTTGSPAEPNSLVIAIDSWYDVASHLDLLPIFPSSTSFQRPTEMSLSSLRSMGALFRLELQFLSPPPRLFF